MNAVQVPSNLMECKWFETGLEAYRLSGIASRVKMLRILQNIKSGETMLAEVPAPLVRSGSLLIATHTSLVSAGTERMLMDFFANSMINANWFLNVNSYFKKMWIMCQILEHLNYLKLLIFKLTSILSK